MKNVGGNVGRKQKQPEAIWLKINDLIINFRDPAGTRTQDPYIKSVLLYQLSYQFKNFYISLEPYRFNRDALPTELPIQTLFFLENNRLFLGIFFWIAKIG